MDRGMGPIVTDACTFCLAFTSVPSDLAGTLHKSRGGPCRRIAMLCRPRPSHRPGEPSALALVGHLRYYHPTQTGFAMQTP